MIIKFPKSVNIISFYFDIITDDTIGGGHFDINESTITIGTKHLEKDPSYVFSVICHEVMEVISELTRTRYNDPSVDGNYKFFMDHKEFEMNIKVFSSIISQFIQ